MMVRKCKLLGLLLTAIFVAAGLSGCSIGTIFSGSGLVISEVCPSNASSLMDDEFGTPDWIELYNGSNAAINLKGYSVSDDIKSPVKFLMPDVSIASHAYMIVYCTKLVSKTPNTKVSTGFKLSANGGVVILMSAGGDTLSKLEVPALSPDQAYARNDKGAYQVTATPTPGKANSILVASSKTKITEMASTAPVHITELMVKNGYSLVDEDGERSGWVEVENSSANSVALSGYRLSDDADNPAKWAFPNVTLAAGQRVVVFLSGKNKVTQSGQMHASFRLGSSDQQLCLLDMVNSQMQTVAVPPNLAENLSYGMQNNEWLYFGQPTPGQPNTTHGFKTMPQAKLFDPNGLYISEVSAVQDYNSSALDWAEIHNGGSGSVNLSGYYLSDDFANLKKGKIGSASVSAGGFTTISMSGNSTKSGGSVLPFGLSASGETLILSSPEGVPIDVFDTGVLRPGLTSGRNNGDASGTRVFFTTPTPGSANGTSSIKGYAEKPVFSEPGGIKSSAVSVSITCPTANAKIYYTTDGSTPTTSSNQYQGPVSISTSKPLRAIAYCDGMLHSDISTTTYLYTQPHTVPIVCLSMAPGEFNTMYSNTKTYVNIERQGNVEYYEKDGKLGTMFPAMVRVQGWSSRMFNQKSLTFKLDDAFGKDKVTYPFFDGYKINTFTSLSVRSGGQDRYKAYVRDAFFSHVAMMDGVDADVPNTRFVVLYVNGEYRGLYDLREDISSSMLASHHGLDPTTVNYMRRAVVVHGSNADWQNICAYGRSHDLNVPANYAQFCQWVDVNAWADYLVLRNYFRETDLFNQKYWNTNDGKVKLRPIYFDNDYSIGGEGALTTSLIGVYNSFSGFTTKNGTHVSMDVTASLWTSSQFKKLFATRWAYLSTHVFQPDKLVALLNTMQAEMEPEMQRQVSRWGQPSSMSSWKSEMNELKSLLQQRPTSAKQLLINNFSFSQAELQELYK